MKKYFIINKLIKIMKNVILKFKICFKFILNLYMYGYFLNYYYYYHIDTTVNTNVIFFNNNISMSHSNIINIML